MFLQFNYTVNKIKLFVFYFYESLVTLVLKTNLVFTDTCTLKIDSANFYKINLNFYILYFTPNHSKYLKDDPLV